MILKLVRWNGHGIGWKAPPDHRFSEFRVYAQDSYVQVWAEVVREGRGIEALQYLEPWQAVRIGLGFLRAAFRAVWGRR